MVLPIKPFSASKNGTDVTSAQLSPPSGTVNIEAGPSNTAVNHNNLWQALRKSQIELSKQEKKQAKEWRLTGIDRLDIVCRPETRAIVEVVQRIRTVKGQEIRKTDAILETNANIIRFADRNVAVVAQYPTCYTNQIIPNMKQELTRHIQMLLDDKTPLLLVLTSDSVMAKNNMFPYFSQNRDYLYDHVADFTRVRTNFLADSKNKTEHNELNLASYQMKIIHAESSEAYRSEHSLPVIHVKNAPDRMFALTAVQLCELVVLINERIGEQAAGQPVITDVSGTGPAAQLAIAMYIYDQLTAQRPLTADHVAEMVQEARMQRSSHMIETQSQFDALLDFLKIMQKTASNSSEPTSLFHQIL